MKASWMLAVVAGMISQAAVADYAPGRYRAIEGADLEILSATGRYDQVKEANLTLNLKEGGEIQDTMFFLNLKDGIGGEYRVVKVSQSRCGSTSYEAVPTRKNVIQIGAERLYVTVNDSFRCGPVAAGFPGFNRGRPVGDAQTGLPVLEGEPTGLPIQARWSVRLIYTSSDVLDLDRLDDASVLEMQGNPEPLFTTLETQE